ncbi:acetyl-CoA hydrolase/transferase C-terminal domain-containing protein [Halobium salinum]|uniref:Acetyl-CoA hydrolase/transferase C-terminal domain-containing protein n=1 Tax=Halobium salinum TaxID=1364940 RepID=A0ABD5PIF2_9EURY|nr:acetyl-CoA hydrolase/transferase C-terminal domain-containing protein [Halobium salinum]
MATETRLGGDLPVVDAETAAAGIGTEDTLLTSGFGRAGYPKALPLALAASDREFSLTVVSGGSVGDEIDTTLVEAGAVARRYPYQATASARDAVNDGSVAFHDRHISRLGDEVALGYLGGRNRENTEDGVGSGNGDGTRGETVAVVEAVAVGAGWLVPTTSVGHTPSYVQAADRIVVELNRTQPVELEALHDVYNRALPPNRGTIPLSTPGGRIGSPRVPFDPDKLEAVVETDRPDSPYEFRTPTAVDDGIAENLAGFLAGELDRNPVFADAVNLQFGVGSLGNALMSSFADVAFGDRDVAYFGEVIQDGLLDMLDDGVLDSASAASLALSAEGQERLFGDIERYAEQVVVRNADVSNSPALIDRFGVLAVNSALEVDVYGNANSTHLSGTHVANGIGGSGDFSRHSALGVLALGSTARDGAISRVVPMVPHVDHTEHDLDVVVTEQGVADLRGLAPRERARELVEQCAHPDYRGPLEAYLDRANEGGGHIPHDLEEAAAWYTR